MSRTRANILAVIRMTVLVILIAVIFNGRHPPAIAQVPIPVLTVEDAVQDNNIHQLNDHLSSTDARVQRQWDAIQVNTMAIAGMQAEERVIGVILGLLSSAGIFIQVRKKQA